jgi:hypothetical protein
MTIDRYVAYADRIQSVSPSYAAWARSVDPSVAEVLEAVPPTKRQPELAFAVARRLGADPADPLAFRTIVLEDPPAFVTALASATTQANDPRRLAPIVPIIGALAGDAPIGLLEVGVSAGLTALPDHATVEYRTTDGTVRMSMGKTPVVALVAEAVGHIPAPVAPIDVVARIGLDPAPIDLAAPGSFERLVESVPPEATDRLALMRAAASAAVVAPPDRITGTVEGDLDAALDRLPADSVQIVLTLGTLVYVPGRERQRFVDRVRERGVHWVSMERTGTLSEIGELMPSEAVLASLGAPVGSENAFATVALDGRPLAVADPFGTRIAWFDQP